MSKSNLQAGALVCGNCNAGRLRLINEGQQYVCTNEDCNVRFDPNEINFNR